MSLLSPSSSLAATEPDCPLSDRSTLPASAAAAEVATGRRVGRFEVLEPLGRGGMAVVFAARDSQLDRRVALKLIHHAGAMDSGFRRRLLSEARAMAQLRHRNVVDVYEAVTDGDTMFIAMEEIEGGTLRQHLEDNPRLGWRQIVDLFIGAGRGLAAAHDAGLVHRDFKPDNVLVTAEGRACVSDFGLVGAEVHGRVTSAALGGPRTSDGILGTPAYMAPEQHYAEAVDHRADQFAFCASLWEALFGCLPFSGDNREQYVEAMIAGEFRAPQNPRGVPDWLRELLERGMAASPADRYPSIAALLDEFAEDDYRSIKRGPVLALFIAIVLGPLTSLFAGPGLSNLIAVIALGTAGCAIVMWPHRHALWRNSFNRRTSLALVFAVLSMPIVGFGLWLFGADPYLSRVMDPLLVGIVIMTFSITVEERARLAPGIYIAAFLASATWPHLAALWLSAANALGFFVLWRAWAPRRRDRSAPQKSSTRPHTQVDALASDPDLRCRRVAHFDVVRRLSEIDGGTLYEGRDSELDRAVSVWLSDDHTDSAPRAARLRHPNVVTVYEVGSHGGLRFRAMEPVTERTLASELAGDSVHDWQRIVSLFVAAGRGLEAAHAAGVIHNAFSAKRGYIGFDGRVKVGGFAARPPRWDNTSSILAPEVVAGGDGDERSDQFAFCAALYEALFRVMPFSVDSRAGYLESIERGPVRGKFDQVPSWVRKLVVRGLHADPAQRYESMSALLDELEPAANHFGPGRTVWGLVLCLLLPLLGTVPMIVTGFSFEDAGMLSLPIMAVLNGGAVALMLGVGLVFRSRISRTQASRTLYALVLSVLCSPLVLIVGAAIGDWPGRVVETLHLAVWFVGLTSAVILYARSLWLAAVVFGVVFLGACLAPTMGYALLAAATLSLGASLALSPRDPYKQDPPGHRIHAP